MHPFSPTGELLGSFLRAGPELARSFIPLARNAGGDAVWAMMQVSGGVRIELWDPDETAPLEVYNLLPEWWYDPAMTSENIEQEQLAGRSNQPRSLVIDAFDGGSVLWVALSHADPDFAQRDLRYRQPSVSRDGVLLALDPSSGRVLAGTSFDEHAEGFTSSGHFVLHEDQGSGIPRIHLKEMALRRKE